MTVISKDQYCVCYGKVEIPSISKGIHEWTFNIDLKHEYMAIGIDDTTHSIKDQGGPWIGCAHFSQRYFLWNDGVSNECRGAEKTNENIYFGTGDKVRMTLNMTERTLSFSINDKKEHIIFEGIVTGEDIAYCMGIHMQGISDSITLLKYETHSNSKMCI